MDKKENTTKSKRGKLYYSFPAISMVPLLLYGIGVIIFSSATFQKSMHQQVYTELQNMASLVDTLLNTAYPGDYALENGTALSLYKGDVNLTADCHLIDDIHEHTGMDVTLFYEDTRLATTIRNWDGERIIGTQAPEQVVASVLEQGDSRFYDDVVVRGSSYFAYYTPLRNSDGQIIGFLFVGKPATQVHSQINKALAPTKIVGLLTLFFACVFSICYANRFMKALYGLKSFFSKVATGNLTEQLDPAVLNRGDELSELGQSALTMQHSLRNLVEMDTLTELYNRRSGLHHLIGSAKTARSSNTPFTLVIGDIDFFKKVNDTYGHPCGDKVLQEISRILRKHMQEKGYAIRWGGEEFLLLYENSGLEEAQKSLSVLLNEVRSTCINADGNQIHVTMTFGMACDLSRSLKDLLKEADDKLYYGKNNGRNQIVMGISQGML